LKGTVLGTGSSVNPKLRKRDYITVRRPRENIDEIEISCDLRQLTLIDVLNYSTKIWKRQEPLAEAVASETVRVIRKAHAKLPSFFWSEGRKWVLGGLFYLVGRKMNAAKTQKQIARCLDTNEMTVKNSYLEWVGHFPELWPEIAEHPKEKNNEKKSKQSSHARSKQMAKFL
jgi:transcription initiation factor TFIIIB Brf1 subunit/transcription initiation factor TFIIB